MKTRSRADYFRAYRAKNREKLRSYNRDYMKRWRAGEVGSAALSTPDA